MKDTWSRAEKNKTRSAHDLAKILHAKILHLQESPRSVSPSRIPKIGFMVMY